MKRSKFCFLFLIILLAASCRKEFVENPGKNQTNAGKPTLLWKARIDSVTFDPVSFDPVVFGDNVIVSAMDANPEFMINVLSGATGEKLGTWHDWTTTPETVYRGEFRLLINNQLVVEAGTEVVSINMDQLTTTWRDIKSNQIINPKRIYGFEDLVYGTARFDFSDQNLDYKKSSIIQYNPYSKDLDTILTIAANGDFSPRIECLAFTRLENGDRIVVGKNRQFRDYTTNAVYEKLGVFCYNMSKNTLLWYVDSVEVGNYGGVVSTVIHDDYAIISGHNYIHCFDVKTGFKNWSYKVDKPLYSGDIVVYNGKLVFKDGWNSLTCIAPESGKAIWKQKDIYGCRGKIALFGNKIFYNDGYFMCLSADNGEIILNSIGADWDSSFGFLNSPAIDPVNRRIYLSDGNFIYALKMPNDW